MLHSPTIGSGAKLLARISEIEWEPCLLVQQSAPELELKFSQATGRPGDLMRYFAGSPWMADAMLRISVQVTTVVQVDADLIDQAGLVVSQDNSCRFCFGVQRAFLRVLGMSEKRIARLEQDLLTGDFTPRERAVIDFSRRISQSKPPVHAGDLEPLRANGFSTDEIAEFAGLIGVHLILNRVSTFIALPPRRLEQLPDQWWARLFRPLLAIKFRRMQHRGKPVTLAAPERSGPFSATVNALDGLPLGRDLRVIIDRLWTSAALPSRTVTLLLAVVARALGAKACEQQARDMLRTEGVDHADTEQILTHLASPILSDTERLLIPLARETVWYQPAVIQRHCAEVQQQLSAAEFLDFCGAVALLNTMCRLEFLADLRE
jgi:AhpD family alkylhydroperoxidase